MLPTPAKFHYIFNLRDLSRIWEGMLNVAGDEVDTKKLALALWKHECTRVIADRFTNEADRKWFEKSVTKVIQDHMGDEGVEQLMDEPYFVDFLRLQKLCWRYTPMSNILKLIRTLRSAEWRSVRTVNGLNFSHTVCTVRTDRQTVSPYIQSETNCKYSKTH